MIDYNKYKISITLERGEWHVMVVRYGNPKSIRLDARLESDPLDILETIEPMRKVKELVNDIENENL